MAADRGACVAWSGGAVAADGPGRLGGRAGADARLWAAAEAADGAWRLWQRQLAAVGVLDRDRNIHASQEALCMLLLC